VVLENLGAKKCYKFNHNIPSWSRWVESLRNLQFHQCFRSRFYTCRSQIRKKRKSSHQCLFALLGSACAKAARKTLMKLTPDEMDQVAVAVPFVVTEQKSIQTHTSIQFINEFRGNCFQQIVRQIKNLQIWKSNR